MGEDQKSAKLNNIFQEIYLKFFRMLGSSCTKVKVNLNYEQSPGNLKVILSINSQHCVFLGS